MNTLTPDAIHAMEALTGFEQKACLGVVEHLKNLGLSKQASSAVCALAESHAMPIKH